MFVYVVMSGYDHEVGFICMVTTDRQWAEDHAVAMTQTTRGQYDYATVEKWDATTGEQDTTYYYEV